MALVSAVSTAVGQLYYKDTTGNEYLVSCHEGWRAGGSPFLGPGFCHYDATFGGGGGNGQFIGWFGAN